MKIELFPKFRLFSHLDGVQQKLKLMKSYTVLRIYYILVWIRIRRSMPLTNGSGSVCGSGSFYYHCWLSRCQQKTNLNKKISAYYFLKVLLHHFSKMSQKEVTKSKNQGFSYYFCLMIEGSGSISLTNGYGSGSATLELPVRNIPYFWEKILRVDIFRSFIPGFEPSGEIHWKTFSACVRNALCRMRWLKVRVGDLAFIRLSNIVVHSIFFY